MTWKTRRKTPMERSTLSFVRPARASASPAGCAGIDIGPIRNDLDADVQTGRGPALIKSSCMNEVDFGVQTAILRAWVSELDRGLTTNASSRPSGA
jgi:hypothetical protein